jgi:CxxC motif-containing protein
MEGKEIICISCPKGCRITVQNRGEAITSIVGNDCPKGIKYAEEEFINPLRILPTTVKVIGGELPLVSVRTEKAIPKRLLLKAMAEIAEIEIKAPVKIGQAIKDDLMGTGVSLIATRNIKRVDSKLFSYKILK